MAAQPIPPKEVGQLVDRFERNLDAYQDDGYNEALVRIEFINPFFEALGWDVANKAGYAEAYKDLIHEDALKIGGATKAPDYSFRVGGARKFFLEAKKPSVKIKDDYAPAYQLRRYAWSAKLPLSILTNFAEFAVYDCRLAPRQSDRASTGRILYLTYKEYANRWEEISSIFSKEAVLRGSFDRFAETGKGRRGTSAVDKEFLTEIESWREALAKNLALRNPRLSVHDLNLPFSGPSIESSSSGCVRTEASKLMASFRLCSTARTSTNACTFFTGSQTKNTIRASFISRRRKAEPKRLTS